MKRVLMIATGGTIASVDEGHGLTPGMTAEQLVAHVPQIAGLCQLDCLQLCNVDSTNVTPAHWLRIARAVAENYDSYDAFVVTHGTDTLAYTAAGLSYLVQDSPKPIVVTGSQLPMGDTFTDAKANLYHSVLYAVDDSSCNVSVVFGGKAIAGTRATKRRTGSPDGFESVNFPVLARFRRGKVVRPGLSDGTVPQGTRPRFYEGLNTRVFVLKLVPGMDPAVFGSLAPLFDAVVVEGFGTGGIPDTPAYREAVFGWLDSGRVMVAASQAFEEGFDMSLYQVGRPYVEHGGLLMAGDMTIEAMVAKTMWALGCTRDPAEVERLFHAPVNHDRLMAP